MCITMNISKTLENERKIIISLVRIHEYDITQRMLKSGGIRTIKCEGKEGTKIRKILKS